MRPAAMVVVVPVHDEAERLGACLRSLEAAFARLPSDVARRLVVVLDACTDGSQAVAEATTPWAELVPVDLRNVGAARARGIEAALETLDVHAERVWIATTDADSRVPADWLTDQMTLAETGVDAVAGTIEVDDWTGAVETIAQQFRSFYDADDDAEGDDPDAHPHVHGSNLGVRAAAYREAGGFEARTTGEDHALWNALGTLGRKRVSSRRLSVLTSARLSARAPAGFSAFLGAMLGVDAAARAAGAGS